MNWQDVLDLLASGENQHTEFIGQSVEAVELAQIMVGLANAEGGQIVLGLDDKNRYFLGTPLTRDFIDQVNEQLCRPPIKLLIETIERSGKNLLVITISGADQKPYSCEDIYYLREETETLQASLEEIQRFHGVPFVPPLKPPAPTEKTAGQAKAETGEIGEDTKLFAGPSAAPPEALNDRQLKLFEFLKNQPFITNRQYRMLYEVSHKTAHQELTDLVGRGLLTIEGAGRGTHYLNVNKSKDTNPPLNLLSEKTGQPAKPAAPPKPRRPRVKRPAPPAEAAPAAESPEIKTEAPPASEAQVAEVSPAVTAEYTSTETAIPAAAVPEAAAAEETSTQENAAINEETLSVETKPDDKQTAKEEPEEEMKFEEAQPVKESAPKPKAKPVIEAAPAEPEQEVMFPAFPKVSPKKRSSKPAPPLPDNYLD